MLKELDVTYQEDDAYINERIAMIEQKTGIELDIIQKEAVKRQLKMVL